MDPADYVYGVLGIFQMKIPRMADPNEVWKTFLAKLEEYLKNMYGNAISRPRIIDRARHGDLRKARNMAHVYKGLLTDNPFGNWIKIFVSVYNQSLKVAVTCLVHLYWCLR